MVMLTTVAGAIGATGAAGATRATGARRGTGATRVAGATIGVVGAAAGTVMRSGLDAREDELITFCNS